MQAQATDRPPASRGPRALDGVRVLEVAGRLTGYTGKMFAGLGADVVLVEPPRGVLMRRYPPFVDDIPDEERSLWFSYIHTGKRGVTLDLDTVDGQSIFRRLAARAHVLLESEQPGVMGVRGLGYERLLEANPALVYTSVTPFGQEGPYAQYTATDTVLLAMGGLLYLGGYPDTPPMRAYGDQAVLAAGQFAAVASMMALLDAEQGGRGCHVDVSAQECVVMAMENAAQYYDLEGRVRRRTAGMRHAGMGVFPCKDGYVYFMARGLGVTKFWEPAVRWFIEEGAVGAEQLLEPQWQSVEWIEQERAKAIFLEVFHSFSQYRTKAQLYEAALERGLPLCPVSTTADLPESEQLKYRRFFVEMPHTATGRTMVMPGAPYKLSETPWGMDRSAPLLGEHNREVYAELGLDADDLAHLKAAGVI